MSERSGDEPRWARFGGFEVDLRSGELLRQGRKIPLADKSLQVLLSLLEHAGELVTREELRARLWSADTFVDFDNNLNAAVSRLREALNDSAQGPRFIETIPRKGYRFVGPPPVWDEAQRTEPGDGRARVPRIALPAIALAAVAAALAYFAARWDGPSPPLALSTERPMVAVLPFESLSEDPHQEYLADGLAEELLAQLAAVAPEHLGVIARTSVRRYRNSDRTIQEIGSELGIGFAVEGSVRVEGPRLRVTAQLIRVSDQTHVWAGRYDREMGDLLKIQNDIAVQVAKAILPRLLLPEGEGREATEDVDALREYLEGLHDLEANELSASRRAVEHFERAVSFDPRSAVLRAAVARAKNLVWFGADSPEEAERISEEARRAALDAIELDPTLADGYVALAFQRLYHHWDARGAAEAIVPPLSGPSNAADALQLRAAALSALARPQEAVASATELVVLDPASPAARSLLGWTYLFAGQPGEAESVCRRAVADHPDDRSANECLYQALRRVGKSSEAVRVLGRKLLRDGLPEERFAAVDPTDPERAIRELENLRLEQIFAQRAKDSTAPFDAAVALAALGDTDRALKALDRAIRERDSRVLYLRVDPRFDSLRADPRFQELLDRIPG